MKENPASMPLDRSYTILLFCYGCLSLLFVALLRFALPSENGSLEPGVAFTSDLHLLYGVAALVVALLRHLKGSSFLPASNALSVMLAIELPLGTALFIYWLARIRAKEQPLQLRPKAVDRYTTGLYIASLCLFALSSILRFAFDTSGEDDLFRILMAAYAGLALVLAAVATVRSLNSRWGYYATFCLNAVLVLLVPLGTVLALIWFLSIREDEQEILAEMQEQEAA